MKNRYRSILPFQNAFAIIIAVLLTAASSEGSEKAFEVFAQHDNTNAQGIGYDVYTKLLEKLSTEVGGRTALYYGAIDQRSAEVFAAYIAELAKLDISKFSKDEQLAYWLNMNNLLVVNTIIAQRSGRAIETLRGDSQNPGAAWKRDQIEVLGVPLSLHDIEQQILLRYFNSPDLVYGMYQGARGGPSLSKEPFEGATVAIQLRELGEDFVNAGRAVKVRSNSAQIPEVYLWYADELFGGDHSAIIDHLKALAKPRLQGQLAKATEVSPQRFSYAIDEAQLRLPSYGGGDNHSNGSSGLDDSYQGGS